MRTRNKTYNTLIQREKYPPLFRCNRISYSTRIGADSTLLHTDNRCVGRVLLFLVFSILLAPILSSCTGDDNPQGYEPYDPHPTWTDSNPDAFWDKQLDGLRLDTVWDGDTTINF